ncbi:TIM barrel protein, partial [bacterium]|nr:TIM barrel protein [bacterium]
MTFPLAAHLCGWPKEVSQDRLRVLQICRDAGYDGVEGLRADSPDDLVELACMAAEHGLELVNVAAPDPETKARFNTTLGNDAAEIPAQWKRDYEATPDGVAAAAEAMKPHVAAFSRLGLKPFHHIHIGTLLETPDDCAAILDLVPDLWLLYDTGHLLAANSDPMDVLARWPDRIAHVHLKNFWTQDPAAGWDRRQPDFWKTSRFCDL